jgi:hypothetical protein
MSIPSVTRAEFGVLIEKGIEAAMREGMLLTDAKALRRIADTAEVVAVGTWECGGVTCPVRQARLATRYDRAPGVVAFVSAFDKAVDAILPEAEAGKAEILEIRDV